MEVLNDKEFEELAKDLLDAKLGTDLEIFKVGKDGGIDLRNSKNTENKYIVQVKHYVGSKFSNLISSLQEEKKKLQAILPKPKHYIVFTSLPLSPAETSNIKLLLEPFITSTDHIYGRKRVENLLSKNKDVERKYFKLWLTSTNVLKTVLHNAVFNNSEFYTEKIIQRVKHYVYTQNIDAAMKKLAENKFLIISGEPGVGKTTLAYMLVYQLLGDGFKLIYSDRSIKDAEQLLSNNPQEKQVVLIDDVLGSNLLELYQPVNTESKIVGFIEKFSLSKNKYLIFTSRTTLLNQANHQYEGLRRSGASVVSNYELKISDYTLFEKAKILYNHLYHGEISEIYAESFYSNRNYLKIIKHKNYYPRLIEFITTEQKFKISGYLNVENFIFDSLTNPDEIWRFAFENQLSRPEQLLLETVFSFGDGSFNIDFIEEAFENRYQYEIEKGNTQRELNGFHNALKKLLDGFLKMEINPKSTEKLIQFINPSLADFLIKYIEKNQNEKYNIWASAVYIEQLKSTFAVLFSVDISIPSRRVKKYFSTFYDNMDTLDTIEENSSVAFKTIDFLFEFFKSVFPTNTSIVNRLLCRLIAERGKLDAWRLSSLLIDINLESIEEPINIVKDNWDEFFALIMDNIRYSGDFERLQELFREYDKDFGHYLEESNLRYDFHHTVTNLFEVQISEHDFYSEVDPADFDYYDDSTVERKLTEKIDQMYSDYISYANLDDYWDLLEPDYNINVSDIIYEYKSNLSADDYVYDGKEYLERSKESSKEDVEEKIHRLFRR
ncbi:restriction endonuclease [Sphingobacterium oryzagri]|uniref:Restriction endonuclease n=1 Tax=Sphingobacterium oryzagri TaxID=3025669 RepID=A0ABY7WI71_9SPHI|nr:restriction endonuclease [Sphingobacterium sp. KACC 22765]WDF69200.1 restriction endonuclease [Sphingobacterium sp. KACC 22765]